VAVFGGGVSGLTAAHELVTRGYPVEVYERQDVFGGKARSYAVDGTGTGGRQDLPGEHGFRIFWSFYANVFDTLHRIQYNASLNVYEYMRQIGANELLTEHGPDIFIDFGPTSWQQFIDEIANLTVEIHYLSQQEMNFGKDRMEIMLTTCDGRMREEFEQFSFAEFVGAQYRSENFTKFFLSLLNLGGIDPYHADLGTTTNFIECLNGPWDENMPTLVFRRPTNEAWIDPWVSQMRSEGAQFYNNMEAQSIICSGDSVVAVNVMDTTTGQIYSKKADYYIFAVPVDKMLQILANSNTSQCVSLNSLKGLAQLQTTWMVGMQFYLHKDVEVTDGFALYLDSPWDVSSVSFRQWWPNYNWSNIGDGKAEGILSAIISNFTRPGIIYNKTAIDCSPNEVRDEVWGQLKAHLNKNGEILTDDNLAGFSLDTSLLYNDGMLHNEEPMFYSSPNSWDLSGDTTTEFSNMVLAGDYVKALTRVTPSCMEAASETGRRAVNAILTASKYSGRPVQIYPPARNPDFAAARAADCIRYDAGLPHIGCESVGCVVNS
jgi:uncharacterized protein with NAD-binding domain and iron-sulfur cluster